MRYQELFSTFCIQYVIEGKGRLGESALSRAVALASAASPGAGCVFETGSGEWVDGATVPIKTIEGSFDGYTFSHLGIFERKIDCAGKPAAEIFLLPGDPFRIVIRVFHGAMDGRGALLWVENIFRALRGETLLEARSPETDLGFLKRLNARRGNLELDFDFKVFPERRRYRKPEVTWKRLTLPGRFPGLVARIAKVMAEMFQDEESRFLIPVDIRRHDREIRSTANLTLPLYLKASRNQDWQDIHGRLLSDLKNNAELNLANADLTLLANLPAPLVRLVMRLATAYQNARGRFLISGIISHLGRISLAEFSCDDFSAEHFFSMPIQNPLIPFSMVAVEADERTEIVISSYRDFLGEASCSEILRKIQEFLGVSKGHS